MPNIELHASCLEVMGHGVLILGQSGIGKSSLCFSLLDLSRPNFSVYLVADDRVILTPSATDHRLIAHAPAKLKGLIEARGFGILPLPRHKVRQSTRLSVVLKLIEDEKHPPPPRHWPPLPSDQVSSELEWLGISVPCITLPKSAIATPHTIHYGLSAFFQKKFIKSIIE